VLPGKAIVVSTSELALYAKAKKLQDKVRAILSSLALLYH
jgi:hypothetical protein